MTTDTLTIAQLRDLWSESEFMQAVINLAHSYGFRAAHFRPVRQQRRDGSVRHLTPVAADGVGFPDIVLAKKGRFPIFMELKAKDGKLRADQALWGETLGHFWHAFRPSDWDTIEELLK